jgi:Polyketide cyclase / dehydrase and lipid transport
VRTTWEGGVRYADGPSTGCDIHIEADPARVWELVTDIGLPARLSPELRRTEWLDGATAPAPGARFAGYNAHRSLGEWRTVSHVVELDAPRAFCWVVVDPDGRFGTEPPDPAKPLATWRFDLEPEAGGTRLRHSVRVGPGRSGLSLAIDRMPEREEEFVAHRIGELRAGIGATLLGVKSLATQAR